MEHSTQPLVSIVIPTWGTSSSLKSCLRACANMQKHINAEVILVFDQRNATQESEIIQNEFPTFRILFNPSPGAANARNVGLRAINGKAFMLIDDDCVIGDKEWMKLVLQRANIPGLHGGRYRLTPGSSYWAQVYNWVNDCWLHFGRNRHGFQDHLLGGFLFGTSSVANVMIFDPEMKWGGEEKELLQRLLRDHEIRSLLHPDLEIEHYDQSGFAKLIRRSFLQGIAAGFYSLHTAGQKPIAIQANLLPGLGIFYFFSRSGILFGKLAKIKAGKVKIAATSPAA